MKLTNQAVAAIKLPPGKSRVKRSDGDGLAIWIEPKQRRWYFRTPTGSDIALENGTFPAMTVEAARRERDVLAALIARGIDPVAHRRAARPKSARAARAAGQSTFGALAEDFIAFQKGEGARPATVEKYDFLNAQLKPLHATPAQELSVSVLAKMLAKIAEKKNRRETARRAAIFCSQVLERAASTTDLGEGPAFAARLARKGLPKVDAENHPAIVDPARLGDLLRAIDAYAGQSDVIRDALKLQAYLFPRPGELRAMRWQDVDLKAHVWLIPAEAAKANRVRRIHLPKQARAIIEGFEWLATSDYVLQGARHNRPMSENTLGAAIAALGFKREHSAHGFRATAKTLMHNELKIPRDVVELCLGHRLGDATEQAYMRDRDDSYLSAERAKAMQQYADLLDSLRDHPTTRRA